MKYANLIGLREDWPGDAEEGEMSHNGFVQWASSYFMAANVLLATDAGPASSLYEAGPVMQTTGLSVELTLKALLRGGGATNADLKKFSHNTYKAYFEAHALFDETQFILSVAENTKHLPVPDEVRNRLASDGEENIDLRWRCFFEHARILDEVYDRPYRSRYITPGPIVLPEPYVLLVGIKLLLNAMLERTGNDLLPNSD